MKTPTHFTEEQKHAAWQVWDDAWNRERDQRQAFGLKYDPNANANAAHRAREHYIRSQDPQEDPVVHPSQETYSVRSEGNVLWGTSQTTEAAKIRTAEVLEQGRSSAYIVRESDGETFRLSDFLDTH